MISASDLNTAFPNVVPGVRPLGPRVLVQLRTVRERTSSGIVMVNDTRDFNKSITQLARIISLGPIAFCNRSTGERWPEGVWANVGDFVRIPKHGGDRFERKIPGEKDETAIFVTIQDHEILSIVEPEAFTEIDEIL
jgi:co-chaperonin GroES (HSP10)